jgi:hippurate hydrolase
MSTRTTDIFWAEHGSSLQALRRDIHAHPELCFAEDRTSALVAEKLQSWGIPVHRGLGKTGLVGVIQKGSSARAIGLRADMDALPMQEHNQFAHASIYAGRMHACGHDGHTATLLATAQYLAQHGAFDGTVYVIFQPAEEGGGGAKAMMDDGLFSRFPMDAIYALHNWPGLPVGTVAASAGPVMGSSNEFKITIEGKGCHAAMPHLGQDPVVAAAALIQSLQTIVSRNLRPIDDAVLSITILRAGEASNVTPNTCTLEGTVRTFTLEVLDTIEARIGQMSSAIAAAYGCSATLVFDRNYPPTINHAPQAEIVRRAATQALGPASAQAQEPTMGAEDFAYMLQATPGCYFFLGNGEGTHRLHGHGMGPCMLHNPSYDFNDALLPLAIKIWDEVVHIELPAAARETQQ